MNISRIPYSSHEEWLSIRKQYIGGSDAGAIMGLNPYSSPYSVWAEKTGKTAPFEGNVITKVGSYLEELVAKMFEEETGKKVQRCNFTLVNDAYPFACANVDRLVVGEDAILECKTTNSYVNIKKFRTGDFPEQWYCQVMHYLAVTGRKTAYLAVLSESREFRIFTVERDADEIAALMDTERKFWEHVVKKTPPAADGSPATTDAINEIYSADDGSSIELFGLEAQLQAREALKAQIKELKEQADSIDNDIKLQMGSASRGTCGKWTVSWSTTSRTNFDYKKFKEDNPAIDLSRYEKDSSSRTLRITEKKR